MCILNSPLLHRHFLSTDDTLTRTKTQSPHVEAHVRNMHPSTESGLTPSQAALEFFSVKAEQERPPSFPNIHQIRRSMGSVVAFVFAV